MTPLRQRLIDDLRLRNYSPRTIEAYTAGVARLAKHFNRSPDQLGIEDLRQFQLHLLAQQVSWSLFNVVVSALRFFYGTTLNRPDTVPFIAYGKRQRSIPAVLSVEEVRALFAAAESQRLLKELRRQWWTHRSRTWLFPGQTPDRPLHPSNVQRLFQAALRRAKITKRATPHTLRHSFATHLLVASVDVVAVQHLLGHGSLSTTAHYLHMSLRHLQRMPSLLDLIAVPASTTSAEDRP